MSTNTCSRCRPSTALSGCAVGPLLLMPRWRLPAGVPSEPSTRLSQFAAHLLRKNRGAARAMPPPGLSDASALRSAFVALARLLRPALEGAHGPLPPFPAGAYFLAVRASWRHASSSLVLLDCGSMRRSSHWAFSPFLPLSCPGTERVTTELASYAPGNGEG